MPKNTGIIRKVYLYLVTAITIVILLIGFIGLINLVLKEYVLDVKGWEEMEDRYWECEQPEVFIGGEMVKPVSVAPIAGETNVDRVVNEECIADAKSKRELNRKNDLKRDLAQYLAMILVALPLYLFHWGVIKKEK